MAYPLDRPGCAPTLLEDRLRIGDERPFTRSAPHPDGADLTVRRELATLDFSVDEHTVDPVESADKARGYEVGKGDYMLVEDDELEAVAIESQHTIDNDRFVPRAQIDERYLDAPYYLVPNDKVGQDAFASSETPCAARPWLRSAAWCWRSPNV